MPGDFFFLNYGIQDGNVMQGLFRVNKTTYQLEVYNGSQWVVVNVEGDATATPLTTAQRMAYAPASGALIWDVDEELLYVGDGLTTGGVPFGSAAVSMTSAQRTAITPRAGMLIWDTTIGALFIGDGSTAGGINTSTNLVRGATNGVIIEDGIAKADTATVKEVLTGSTGFVNVDADNLRGALSVGQAVDVSCGYRYTKFNEISTDGINFSPLTYPNDGDFTDTFKGDFWLRKQNAEASVGLQFGFTQAWLFPKRAPNLSYLFILDLDVVSGSYDTTNLDSIALGPNSQAKYQVKDVSARYGNASEVNTGFKRLAIVFYGDFAVANIGFTPNAVSDVVLHIKNWRQYEVTALTDEAIAYIAQLPDPDAFFRSTSAYSIRDKYLIKQDMVCPFIPTINMPDNSAGLTVGAGLSYQIKYTKTGTYSVSVDTIPADAYGWDAHISMFVKDTAVVQFQAPLILMDALTPNSGHNLSVKFRNGNALVYVDDTNAGTVVYLATGTTTTKGSLPYALSQTPPSEDATFTNFVVFSPVLGGTVCSLGTMSNVAYNASLIGNNDDETIIGGTIGLASGKYLAVQDINLNDVEITSGTLNIGNNVKVTGTTSAGVTGSGIGSIVLDESCLLDFSDQTNNVPITGASISAVSGAKVIPYGETESEAISAGTGNAVNKYGKCGYLVSVASGTASNTLYDALVGGGTAYSNIIFDPALDGSTVSVPVDTVSTRSCSIYGSGIDETAITGQMYLENENCYDCTITALGKATGYNYVIQNGASHFLKNCRVNNCTNIGTYAVLTGSFYDCIIEDNNTGNRNLLYLFNNCKMERCTFTNNETRDTTATVWVEGTNTQVYYCNCSDTKSHVVLSVKSGNSSFGSCTVTGCTFGLNSNIRVDGTGSAGVGVLTFSGTNILNSTVSGAGSVVFADGATVTSTIPSGSTIGTGVIDLSGSTSGLVCPNKSFTLEGITITGATTSNSSASTAIYTDDLVSGSTVHIKNCIITGNTNNCTGQVGWGAGIKMYSSGTQIIENCTISNNVSPNGGGALMIYGGYTELHNIVVSNCGTQAIYFFNEANTVYINGLEYTTRTNASWYTNNVHLIPVRIQAGSTIQSPATSYTIMDIVGSVGRTLLSVGSYNENGEWIVGGTASLIIGTNTSTIKGVGERIREDGLNNLEFTHTDWNLEKIYNSILTNEELIFAGTCVLTFATGIPEIAIRANPITVPAGATLQIVNVSGNTVTIEGGANGKTGTYIKNTGEHNLA